MNISIYKYNNTREDIAVNANTYTYSSHASRDWGQYDGMTWLPLQSQEAPPEEADDWRQNVEPKP